MSARRCFVQLWRRLYLNDVPRGLRCGEHEAVTYAMLDIRSQQIFCESRLARKLKASGPRQSVPMYTLSTGFKAEITNSMAISLTICGSNKNRSVERDEMRTVPHILRKASSVPLDVELKHMRHLRSITLSKLKDKSVELFIGWDASTVFRPLQSTYGPKGTPDAIKTVLGCVLFSSAPDILKTYVKGVPCLC